MRRAFTLVEILIVVVILGILAAIVVPQFTNATTDAQSGATRDQLAKLRNALGVYFVRNNEYPQIAEGDGTWGELITTSGEYLKFPPRNLWVPEDVSTTIVYAASPDGAYQTTHGWIYNPSTGDLWAGSFDGDDNPHPRP